MTRPLISPVWATDTNYPAGSDEWSATPTKVAPSGGKVGTGVVPDTDFPAQEYNYMVGNHGAWLDHLDGLLMRPDFYLHDDFCGVAVDTGKWVLTGSPSSGANIVLGVFGATALLANGGTPTMSVATSDLPVGTGDFRFVARVMASPSGAGGTIHVGFHETATPTNSCTFSPNSSTGYWDINYPTGLSLSTGVVYLNSLQFLECRRLAGTLQFLIDGAIVLSVADATNIAQAIFYAEAHYTLNTQLLWVDSLTCWVKR